jgi:polygalacturonase
VGDGKTLNTDAIQKTIDACAAAGGGTVVVPKGTFLSGAIFIKKPVNFRVDKDGVLKGTTNVKDYPIIDSRFEGIERPVMAAFVNVLNVDGITVSGEGTIDGSGDAWLALYPRGGRGAGRGATTAASQPASRPAQPLTAFDGPRTVLTPTPDHPPAQRLPGGTLMKPRLFNFTNCHNVAIKDLHLQNQAIWCLHILYCTDVLVDHVDILDPTHRVPSSDGIDIDSSKRVRVDHTTISVNDDCISIKSGKDEDGRRVNRPSEQILIVNTHFAEGQGGAAMGSEVSGGIHDVEVRDCISDKGNWAPIRLKTQPTRGGIVENIVYRNVQVDNVRQAFEFNLAWNMRINTAGESNPTTMRNVYLINVSGKASSAGSMNGLADKPITDVHFIDCHITANSGLRMNNVERIDTSGLTVKNAAGEVLPPTTGRAGPPPGAAGTPAAPVAR